MLIRQKVILSGCTPCIIPAVAGMEESEKTDLISIRQSITGCLYFYWNHSTDKWQECLVWRKAEAVYRNADTRMTEM